MDRKAYGSRGETRSRNAITASRVEARDGQAEWEDIFMREERMSTQACWAGSGSMQASVVVAYRPVEEPTTRTEVLTRALPFFFNSRALPMTEGVERIDAAA
jgi:hypothetical protein